MLVLGDEQLCKQVSRGRQEVFKHYKEQRVIQSEPKILCLVLKAGILMYTKEFEQFVWEEELQVLKLPHFYLGKLSCPYKIT